MRSFVVFLGLVLLLAPSAYAGQIFKKPPQSAPQVQLSYAPIVKRAAPAVVNVYSRRVVKRAATPFANDPFFGRLFGRGFFGPQERVQQSLGSGVIVGADGVIVTNNHVVNGADELRVVLADRREFDAKLLLSDKQADLAVLKIDVGDEALPIMHYHNDDDAEVGDLVLAIGNPFGVGQTVTGGIVSALARTDVGASDYSYFIQTDAAINPGNSGGALVDMNGDLLGVNTVIVSRSGGSNGIGFAIPVAMVARVVEAAINGGKVVRPWFGARLQTVDRDLAASLGLARPHGALVSEIYPGGPAARAGILRGDVVAAIDGHEINSEQGLRFRLATHAINERVPVAIIREGEKKTVKLKAKAAPEIPKRNETVLEGINPLAGARVANLSPALAQEIRLDEFSEGVVILDVDSNSPARYYGLRSGDIVLTIGDEDVPSVKRLTALLAAEDGAPRWPVAIRRGGKRIATVIRMRR